MKKRKLKNLCNLINLLKNEFCEDKKESFQIQKQIFFENFRVSNKRIARNDSSKTKINDSSKTKITHHYFITNEP